MRLAPNCLTAVAAISVALIAGRAYQPAQAEEVPALSSDQMAAMEAKAFAAANAPAGLTAPEAVHVQIRPGETFEQAVRRTGIGSGLLLGVGRRRDEQRCGQSQHGAARSDSVELGHFFLPLESVS